MAVGPDAFAIGRCKRQVARAGTGRDDDVLRGQRFFALVAFDDQRVGSGQPALTHMDGDLVLLHQMCDALIELLRNAARAFDHRIDIRADIRRSQPIGPCMLHIVIDFRRAQQRLGRNAAPIEADAAEIFTLYNCGFKAELGCTDCGNIATGAGTEDDKVVVVSHFTPPTPAVSPPVP